MNENKGLIISIIIIVILIVIMVGLLSNQKSENTYAVPQNLVEIIFI